jgi:hypothetical protein
MADDDYHPIGRAFDVGRSIGNAFAAVRVAAAPLWLGGLLIWISGGNRTPVGMAMNLPQLASGDSDAWAAVSASLTRLSQPAVSFLRIGEDDALAMLVGFAVVILVFGLAAGLLLFALHCWLQPGFIRLHESVLEHASDATTPLFSGKDRFWSVLGWNALDRLALGAAGCVAAWPGALVAFIGWRTASETLQLAGATIAAVFALPALIYVGLGTYLGAHAVVLEGKGPVHALRRSFGLAHGNRFPLLFFATVCVLLEAASLAGVFLCCVGLLLTAPFAVAISGFARTEGFLLMTRGWSESHGWALWRAQSSEAQAVGPSAASLTARSPTAPPVPSAFVARPTHDVPRGWAEHLQSPPDGGSSSDDEESG